MFFNDIEEKKEAIGEMINPGHGLFLKNYKEGGQHLIPMLMMLVIVILQNWFIKYLTKLFLCLGILKEKTTTDNKPIDFFAEEQEMIVDENLGSYWNCMGGME